MVYSKANCPQCVKVKNELILKGVDFEEISVDKDAAMRSWLIAAGHRSVPVVYVDDKLTDPATITAEIVA